MHGLFTGGFVIQVPGSTCSPAPRFRRGRARAGPSLATMGRADLGQIWAQKQRAAALLSRLCECGNGSGGRRPAGVPIRGSSSVRGCRRAAFLTQPTPRPIVHRLFRASRLLSLCGPSLGFYQLCAVWDIGASEAVVQHPRRPPAPLSSSFCPCPRPGPACGNAVRATKALCRCCGH